MRVWTVSFDSMLHNKTRSFHLRPMRTRKVTVRCCVSAAESDDRCILYIYIGRRL